MPPFKALRGRYEVNLVAEMTCSQVWVDVLVRTISWLLDNCSDFCVCVWECVLNLSVSWCVASAALRAPCSVEKGIMLLILLYLQACWSLLQI
jgi:hypothetical protein